MAAIRIKTNIGEVSERILKRLEVLNDKDYLIRPICFDVIDLMTRRIHERGENSSGKAIGQYNSHYLQLREKKYNRSSDTKIIVSLTRQLENDWNVIATDRGYGIGFLNPLNAQKARWVEENKGQKIFSMSNEEIDHAVTRFQELVRQAISDV